MSHDHPDSRPTADHFDTDVLIVGAGPTGLTLASALAARGVRATVIDRLAEGDNTRVRRSCTPARSRCSSRWASRRRSSSAGCRRSASRSATATAC